jgi:thymidine kinase
MYEEVIAKYRIGSAHKAVYANLTGNQMWSIVQSKFGQPSQQSAIAEARQACEDHARQSNLDPSKCVPVAVDDQQVFDPGPLFSAAQMAQDLQANLSALETPPRE